MRWILQIDTDDVVRRTLNQGLQIVTIGLSAMGTAMVLWNLLLRELGAVFFSAVVFVLITLLAFALTRRGGMGGALLLFIFSAGTTAASFSPETYADPPVIHAVFLLPSTIAALFIAPSVGLLAALIQSGLLTLRLLVDGWPRPVVTEFLIISSVDLCGVMLPIVVAAAMFRAAIARLSALTTHLDSQVAERTAELRRIMDLRESDIAAVVHDIQNRMTVVQAEVDDLLAGVAAASADPSALRAAERRLDGAVRSVGDLIEDLRTAVQLDNAALRLHPEPVELEALARRVADQLSAPAAQAGCALSVTSEQTPPISGDERKLERALTNLIGNAIKYSRQLPAAMRQVKVTVRRAAGGVEVVISDQGPGLSPEALKLLGQPFVRLTSARGTEGMGLGVYISRGIVELHGGGVRFSSPGEAGGTTVTIWLPLERAGLTASGAPPYNPSSFA